MQLSDVLKVNGYSDRWSFKEKTGDVPQIELKCTVKGSQGLANILVIVATEKGYNHSFYKSEPDQWNRSTRGYSVHISTNGALQLQSTEFLDDLTNIVKLCQLYLKNKY